MEQLDLIVSSDLPPPPRLKFAEPMHEKVYRIMCGLEAGQHLRWPAAPRSFISLVKRWVVKARVPGIDAYREVDGDGIVRRLVDGPGFPMTTAIDDDEDDDWDEGEAPEPPAAPPVETVCPTCKHPMQAGGACPWTGKDA